MATFTSQDIITFFLGLAVLLGVARAVGELALRYRQPVIVGEIFGGILLGPAVFGYVAPEFSGWLLPITGGASTAGDYRWELRCSTTAFTMPSNEVRPRISSLVKKTPNALSTWEISMR